MSRLGKWSVAVVGEAVEQTVTLVFTQQTGKRAGRRKRFTLDMQQGEKLVEELLQVQGWIRKYHFLDKGRQEALEKCRQFGASSAICPR